MPTMLSRSCDDGEPGSEGSLPECALVCGVCDRSWNIISAISDFVETLQSSSILRYNRAMAASAAILK
jgi:hypothetical protein